MKKIVIMAAVAACVASSASAAVISNGIDARTPGFLSFDVTSGGETRTGLFKPSGPQAATDVIFDYFTYVRTGGTTFRLNNGTLLSSDANQIVYSGRVGTTGINWTSTSVLPAGGTRLTTSFDFSAAAGSVLPSLDLYQYLDEDVIGERNDVFFTRGSAAAANLELFTFDPVALFGISHGGAYTSLQGLVNASFIGYGLCEFNLTKPAIVNGTQSVSLTGARNADCPTTTLNVPELGGTVDGPYDIVSVLAWNVAGGTSSARILTSLGGIADVASIPVSNPVPVPNPVPEPAAIGLMGLGLLGLGFARRRKAA
jgi:PEP-CTERM motif